MNQFLSFLWNKCISLCHSFPISYCKAFFGVSTFLLLSTTIVTAQVNPEKLINVNGTLYFIANRVQVSYNYQDPTNNGKNGFELWKSDGTAAGTVKLKDLPLGQTDGQFEILPITLINANGTLFFTANNFTWGYELWKSDGTPQGTVLVREVRLTGERYARPKLPLTSVNNIVYFAASDATDGYTTEHLWKTNGTAAGTVKLGSPNVNAYGPQAGIDGLTRVGNGVYFTTYHRNYGNELWKSNGTPEGTMLVKDIYPGPDQINPNSSFPQSLTDVNGTLFFSATTPVQGRELWKSDGTAAGTVLVKDLTPGYEYGTYPLSSNPINLININGTLYFTTEKFGTDIRMLWKSDGTAAGTIKLAEMYDPEELTNVNGTLYFTVGDRDEELWKSNGTPEGTVPVTTFDDTQSFMYELTNVNGTLFFSHDQIEGDYELWKSDGTEAGTVLVKDIYPGSTGSNPSYPNRSYPKSLTAMNNTLFFSAFDGTATNGPLDGRVFELWKSNGTAAGTVKVKPANVCSATGSILREYWSNITGNYVTAIPVNSTPTSTSQVTSFEGPVNAAENYGARYRGYICAPATGSYTFYISGDDNSELYLSTDDQPATKTRIASVPGSTGVKVWNKYSTQKSATISLQAGKKYYVEVLHKEGLGGDNLAVGWTVPGSSSIVVIPGSVLSPFVPVTCTASGSILREYWSNITGNYVTAIPVNTTPTSTSQVTSFQGPVNVAENYGARYRGYICAPATGSYTFYISGDDNSELWLSTDDNAANKRKIASVPGSTGVKVWNKYSTQKSGVISLQAGKKYYIEALHKEGLGGDNLAVGWMLPNTSAIAVISGSYLSPFVPTTPTGCTASGSILREYWSNITGNYVTAIPVNSTPTSTSQVTSFEGPVNAAENYGARYRGYICAPATGSYTFYISGDDNSELYLSTDDQPATKTRIASVPGSTGVKVWNKYSTQKSATISLQAGKKYYVEVLHKEGLGSDNLAVGWTVPGSSSIVVIAGSYLSPFVPTSNARLASEQTAEAMHTMSAYPNPFADKLTIALAGVEGKLTITVVDVVGREQLSTTKQVSREQQALELDFSSYQLKAGVYLLRLQAEDGKSKVIRVVKN